MFNNLMFLPVVVMYLLAVLLFYKLFGKSGLYAFTVFSTILANLQVCKCIDLFGLSTTAGNVIYAATFLVTDILSEKYGKKSAQKAVYIGIAANIMWILGTQELLLFTPNSSDMVSESLSAVLQLVPRISIASLIGYVCSQSVDVTLYHAIWRKSGGTKKYLWLRNNASTLISQMVDTVVFTFLAFWGTYETPIFISILLTTYLFKAIVALLDTPFIYLSRHIHGPGEKELPQHLEA